MLAAAWFALLPWAGLWPGVSSWHALWLAALAGVWLGWLSASYRGTLARVPMAPTLLVAWAGFLAWCTTAHFLKHYGTVPVLLVVPVGCLVTAHLGLQWMRGWSTAQTNLVWRALRWSMLGLVLYGFAQAGGYTFQVDDQQKAVIGGTLGNPTLFAGLLAMLLPVWVAGGGGWYRAAGVAMLLLLLCGSVTALLAAILSLAWLAWRLPERRTEALTVLGVALLGVVIGLGRGSGRTFEDFGRLDAWRTFVELWTHRPLTGHGLGSVWSMALHWPEGNPLYKWSHVHNEYLQVLVELGLIGVGLFAALLHGIGKRADAMPMEAAVLLACGVCSLTSFPLHGPLTGTLALLAYARVLTEGAT